MQNYKLRLLETSIIHAQKIFPVVAILGPRQCGKSTLAKHITEGLSDVIYLDLERPSDLAVLNEAEYFFKSQKTSNICIDEIQLKPELFPLLRVIVDENKKKGQYLILGSASQDLIKQSSESLAGRISYLELTPFSLLEIIDDCRDVDTCQDELWIKGGFPESFFLSESDSLYWREEFIKTYLERDLRQFDINVSATSMRQLWTMLAHQQGQTANYSSLGKSLGMSDTTVKRWLTVLKDTFMIRLLPSYAGNTKKRLVKSPRVYIRDSGILHALLNIKNKEDLLKHPISGFSWEGFAIENILTQVPHQNAYFFRTSDGTELDLILEKDKKLIGIECKISLNNNTTRAMTEIKNALCLDEIWIVSPMGQKVEIKKSFFSASLWDFISYYK